jgi:acyl-CoA synthetase (NDP forming)
LFTNYSNPRNPSLKEMKLGRFTREQFDCFFNPESVAIIGASDQYGKWGNRIMQRVLTTTSSREVYTVNRDTTAVKNRKSYASVLDIPGPVDLGVIAIPVQATLEVVIECLKKEVKALAIVTAGFSEHGEEGTKIQQELQRLTDKANIPVLGPNCLGYLNTFSDLTVCLLKPERKGPVSVISHSGNVGGNIVTGGVAAGIGFSKFISTGNEVNLRLEDFLEYLADDDDTEIIVAYMEGLREGRRFYELAKRIAVRKPIVALKSGYTDAGARAVNSHTANLAGDRQIYSAAFKQAGVIEAQSIEEVIDTVGALLRLPLPRGNKVTILSQGGGPGVLATDACSQQGLDVAPLSPGTTKKLDSLLPAIWPRTNPVDTIFSTTQTVPCLLTLMGDPDIDIVLALSVPTSKMAIGDKMAPQVVSWLDAQEKHESDGMGKVIELMDIHQKPVILCDSPSSRPRTQFYHKLQEEQMPTFPSIDRAVKAISNLVWYGKYLSQVNTE